MPTYLRRCVRHQRIYLLGCVLSFLCTVFLLHQRHEARFDNMLSNKIDEKKNDKPLLSKVLNKNELELLRFATLLKTWPADKPKATIHYLLQNQYEHINRSLTALHNFFNKRYRYPIIIFHEKDFNVSKIIEIGQRLSIELIFFQEIEFKVPDFVRKPVPENIRFCTRSIGYRHMCRFQAKAVYDQPIMQGLDYGWRLDDDSFLLGNVTYDLFKYMRDKELLYGYTATLHDPPPCAVGLWDAVHAYAIGSNKTEYLRSWHQYKTYFNNFEISAMSVWRSKEYSEYFDSIDRLGGIYWHRWGDAPIKTFAVLMFVPATKVHFFNDIFYYHKFFKRLPKT